MKISRERQKEFYEAINFNANVSLISKVVITIFASLSYGIVRGLLIGSLCFWINSLVHKVCATISLASISMDDWE